MTQNGHHIAITMGEKQCNNKPKKKNKRGRHPGQPPAWAAHGGFHGRGG